MKVCVHSGFARLLAVACLGCAMARSALAAPTPAPASSPAQRVFITEFMAANTRSLLDRDRDYSDWIELYNAGSDPVNLEGWCLTDDRRKLDKWRFPAVTLPPSEYLVVFASGKHRRSPGSELHTNFKLDADGEYLALVRPDGKTVANEFGPKFPSQAADTSFGLAMSNPSSLLVREDAPKKVFVPKSDIGMSWLTAEFDDSSWTAAQNGVGFDSRGTYKSRIGLDLRSQMIGRNSSAYLRIPFVLTNNAIESLKLRVRYDDGFVAYLNGWEVARANAPATMGWNAAATAEHGSAAPISQVEHFDGNAPRYWTAQLNSPTRPKEHVRSPGSADRHLRLVNGQMANQVNSIAFPSISDTDSDAASLDLDYRFSGTGEGTERLSILLIPNSVHSREGVGVRFEALQNLREPNLPGVFAVQLLHNPENGQNALTLHWDGTRRSTLDVPAQAFHQRVFHHARIELKKIDTGVNVTVTLTADPASDPRGTHANSTLTATVPGMKLGNQRVQVTGRIGHWDQTIDVDELQFQISGSAGLMGEEFDLSGQISALKQGQNILAFHALNHSNTDTNFFILPELLAGLGAVRTTEPIYLPDPTPGGANRLGFPAMAPPPVFSTRGGVFKDTVKVELAAKSGVVRYTMDGSEPTANSPEYSQPVTVNRSMLIKAKTFLANHAPSATGIETYTILDPDLANFTSNLPIIIINSFGRYISANNKSPISVRFINSRNGRTSLLGAADFDGRATANIRGYSTLRQPKNSMTVRLRDENGDKIKAGLFGLPKESDWVLYAPYSDKTLMRDALAYELSNAMGRYAPRTRFVELYVDRNGGRLNGQSDYMGVYVLVERVGLGPNRLNIDPAGPEDIREPAISGGYLFKRDHSERYEPSFRTSQGNRFFYVEPKGTEITREQSAWLSGYVSQFERALYGPSFQDPNQGYARYLDVDAFIDQHWLIEATKNIDGFRYSAYVHKPREGKLTMGPAWDWNLSFGNADYHEGDNPRGWYYDLLRDSEICWYRRLSADPEFMQRTIDRWTELRRSVFSRTRLLRRIDEMAAELNEAQARNFRRWPILGRSVNPNSFVGRTYQEEIDWMKEWAGRRIDWIDSQFLRAPSIKPGNGGALTVSASSGQIYYTLDGSDPRAHGAQPSSKALVYKGPVTVKAGETLRARVRRGEQWSGISSNRDKQE
jgi:hypothetical protein